MGWPGRAGSHCGKLAVLIEADSDGPTEDQRALFAQILNGYPRWAPLVLEALRRELGEDDPELAAGEFVLESITIGRFEPGRGVWEASYASSAGDDWILTAELRDGAVLRVKVAH